jgi:hypothetical protein
VKGLPTAFICFKDRAFDQRHTQHLSPDRFAVSKRRFLNESFGERRHVCTASSRWKAPHGDE